MVHLPRRHFFQARNEKHYKKRGKQMGGYTNLDGASNMPSVQDAIDTLNAAIDRLDSLINDMQENCQCKK
jgi:hypothetical protein